MISESTCPIVTDFFLVHDTRVRGSVLLGGGLAIRYLLPVLWRKNQLA